MRNEINFRNKASFDRNCKFYWEMGRSMKHREEIPSEEVRNFQNKNVGMERILRAAEIAL